MIFIMIKSKTELKKYILADEIMNGYNGQRWNFTKSDFEIRTFLRYMRKTSFYSNQAGLLNRFKFLFCKYIYNFFSKKCGFSIGYNTFGYGLIIPHYGTIVVNSNTQAGNFCVLHTCTCIGGEGKIIGDNLYMSTGSQIQGKSNMKVGKNVSICANGVLTISISDNVLISKYNYIQKENYGAWYFRDESCWIERVNRCKSLFEM